MRLVPLLHQRSRHLLQLQTGFTSPFFALFAVGRTIATDEESTFTARFSRIEEHSKRFETANAPFLIEFLRTSQVLHAFVFHANVLFQMSRERNNKPLSEESPILPTRSVGILSVGVGNRVRRPRESVCTPRRSRRLSSTLATSRTRQIAAQRRPSCPTTAVLRRDGGFCSLCVFLS